MTYVTMFRLDISGDFDLGDLDGTNQYIDKDNQIQNAKEDKYHHHGICVMYMFFTTFIGIGWLNILIGLLSERYTMFYEKRLHLFEAFRVVYMYKSLCFRRLVCNGWRSMPNKGDDQKGRIAWLKYKKSTLSIATPKDIIFQAEYEGALAEEERLRRDSFNLDGQEEQWMELKKDNPFYHRR